MKKFLSAILLTGAVLTGCSSAGSLSTGSTTADAPAATEKIQAMTSFNPVDQLVKYIGGDKVETTLFVPPPALILMIMSLPPEKWLP